MRAHWTMMAAGCGALLLLQGTASAHHSFAAEFDRNQPVTITGSVTKVEWENPHARFYVDAKDEKTGEIANWDFELASPNGLMRRGWTRNSMKIGDVVTVTGFKAKNAPHVGNASTVVLASGKKLFAGSSSETEAPQTGTSPATQ
jgi:uncharacterized protein DUF6152